MSSRRDKQAELRRRMAEARSKLSLLAEPEQSDREREGTSTSMSTPLVVEEAAIATYSSERGETRPFLPPPRGGILRKPKYSNISSFTDDSAPTPTATATCALQSTTTESKGDHRDVGETNNSLGALMADYGDSSSDDDDYNNSSEDAGGIVDDYALSSSSDGYASRETQINPPASASASSFGDNDTETTTPQVAKVSVSINDVEASSKIHSAKNYADATPPIQREPEQSSEISDEVWDEFNALLEEDDNEPSNDAITNEGNTSSMSEGAIAVTDLELPPPATTTSTEKVKKKRKRESKRDMYDNEAAINFEQASYEARLARLMLLKSKKSQQRNNNVVASAANTGDYGTENALLLTTANEFYDPGLAFREEEVDQNSEGGEEDYDGDEGDGSKSLIEKLKERKSVSEFEGSISAMKTTTTGASAGASDSQALKASISAPHTSLAKILRARRVEARKLSTRGGGGVGGIGGKREPETNLLHEDEVDGQWF